MDNWTAFFCGLILGSDNNQNSHNNYGPTKVRNIALQDIAFCQALRNCLDRMEEYSKSSNITPQSFIENLYKDYNFEMPLTDEEKGKIARRKKVIEDYLSWSRIIGTEKWNALSTVEKIWQASDLSHVPDPENLDLLFALGTYEKPIKKNGRLYEYEEIEKRNAKGFFKGELTSIVFENCYETAKYILEKNGYEYDYTRFEYNKSLDSNLFSREKNDKINKEWMIKNRRDAYMLLIKTEPDFVKKPWSELTRDVRLQNMLEKEYAETKVDSIEAKRREDELKHIYATLTASQKELMLANTPGAEIKAGRNLGILFGFLLLGLIIGLVIGIIVIWSLERKDKILAYLRIRQTAYYSVKEYESYKKEYEGLLNPIR